MTDHSGETARRPVVLVGERGRVKHVAIWNPARPAYGALCGTRGRNQGVMYDADESDLDWCHRCVNEVRTLAAVMLPGSQAGAS